MACGVTKRETDLKGGGEEKPGQPFLTYMRNLDTVLPLEILLTFLRFLRTSLCSIVVETGMSDGSA